MQGHLDPQGQVAIHCEEPKLSVLMACIVSRDVVGGVCCVDEANWKTALRSWERLFWGEGRGGVDKRDGDGR